MGLINPKFTTQKGIGKVELAMGTHDDIATVVWCPGDGYRYTVIIQNLPEPVMQLIGGTDNHVLVSYYNGTNMTSWALNRGNVHILDYVARHFNVSGSTAKFLTALLNMAIDGGHFDFGLGMYEGHCEQYNIKR